MRDQISAAVAFYTNGQNFRNSAQILENALEADHTGAPKSPLLAIPYYVLISHAAELFLKAALVKRGHTESQLSKFQYGHDLLALLNELQAKGVSVSRESAAVISGLHQQHKEHTLRYMKFMGSSAKVYFPPFQAVNSTLEELFGYTRLSGSGA